MKTLTVQYRNQKGEKKVVTNHEMHEFLERGLYRKDIAEKLNISQARLRKLMETLNMWKMRVKLTNVNLISDESEEPEPEPVIVEEPVKPPVIDLPQVPAAKKKRPRATKVHKGKKVAAKKEDIQVLLQHELDQVRKVREEFALTVMAFKDKLKKASEILNFEEIQIN